MKCSELEIRVTGKIGEHHVCVKDIKRIRTQAEEEKVLEVLQELHRIMKITHLKAESVTFTRTLQSEMKYIGALQSPFTKK